MWCAVLAVVAGCNSEDTEDDPIECGPGGSCPMGYVCDLRTNKCIASTSRDAGADGAPALDARVFDASVSTVDAPGAIDAGPPDARIDAMPGDTEILNGPPARTSSLMATFTFSGGGTYVCRVDSAAFAPCPMTHTVTVAEGAHTLQVAATPAGGVQDPTPASYMWTVDRTGPTVTLGGPNQGATTGRMVTFTWTVEAGAAVSCSMDSTVLAPCNGGMITFTGLSGGAHTFRIRAEDDVGNDGPQIDRGFTVDAVGPTTMINAFAGNLSDAAGTITYSSETGATFECRINAASYASCPAAGLPFTGLAPGNNTVRVRATDTHGNLGGEAMYTWDVFGTAQVLVAVQAEPVEGSVVVSHRANGAVISETSTAANGRAVARVLPGSQVTALYSLRTPLLSTITEVQPGDNLRFDNGNRYPGVAVLRVGGDGSAGAFEHLVAVGGRGLYGPTAVPLNGDFEIAEESYDTAGRVSFVGQARANGAVQRLLTVADRVVPRGSTTDLVVTRDMWTDAIPWRFQVTNVESAFSIEPGVYRRGVSYPIADGQVSDFSQSFTFHVTQPGFADGRYVRLRAREAPVYRSIVTTDVDALDFAQLMPEVTDVSATQPVVGRPQVSWTTASPVPAADGTFVQIQFVGGDGEPSGFWVFVVPPTTSSVQAPVLPASLSGRAPTASATFPVRAVQIVESTALAGYAPFRQHNQRFVDPTAGAFSDFDAPPVVPGPGTTTRTTLRLVTPQ